MSSSTPGQEDVTRPTGAEPAQPAPAPQDRTAIRTSLAERFAAAKGVSEHPVVPRPDDTAPAGAQTSTPTAAGRLPGGSAPAPPHELSAPTTAPPPPPSAAPS